jgi:hypothetical protein
MVVMPINLLWLYVVCDTGVAVCVVTVIRECVLVHDAPPIHVVYNNKVNAVVYPPRGDTIVATLLSGLPRAGTRGSFSYSVALSASFPTSLISSTSGIL